MPQLGGAESFAVLGGIAVANSDASTVSGDVGVAAGGTITGFPPGTLATGSTIHIADAVASQAHHDAVLAYEDLAGRTCETNQTDQNLGGQTLAAGVYCFDGDATLTGALTLTGTGPWIFQVGGALRVSPGATIVTPGLPPTDTCRGTSVYWQVAGDDDNPGTPPLPSTIGAGAAMVGNLMARGDVTVDSAVTVDGRVISLGGEAEGGHLTLTANTVGACGTYTWLAGLTETGTMNLLSGVSQRSFTVRP